MPNKLSVDNRTDPPLALGRSPSSSSSSAPHTVGGSLGERPMDGRTEQNVRLGDRRSVGRSLRRTSVGGEARGALAFTSCATPPAGQSVHR